MFMSLFGSNCLCWRRLKTVFIVFSTGCVCSILLQLFRRTRWSLFKQECVSHCFLIIDVFTAVNETTLHLWITISVLLIQYREGGDQKKRDQKFQQRCVSLSLLLPRNARLKEDQREGKHCSVMMSSFKRKSGRKRDTEAEQNICRLFCRESLFPRFPSRSVFSKNDVVHTLLILASMGVFRVFRDRDRMYETTKILSTSIYY